MFKKTVLPLIFLALALAGVVVAYRAGHPIQNYLFHSDALYLPALFADLFSGGGRLADWYLTPAPYFFPDFPIFLLAYLVGEGPYQQILAYGLLQTLLTMVALYFVVRASAERYHLATASLIAIVLIWLAVNAAEPYVELFTSAYHFGAFLSTLGFVAFWLTLERDGGAVSRRPALAGMCVLAFLTSLSDNIFLVQAIVPFIATWVLLRRTDGRGWRALGTPGAVLLAGILGSLSYKLIVAHSTRYPTKLGVSQLGANLHELLAILARLFTAFPLLGLVVCAYLLLGIACVIAVLRKRGFLDLPQPLLVLVTFSMLSMGATLAAVLLVTNLPVSPRYLVSVLLWPVVVSVLLTQHWLGARFFWAGAYGSGIFALLLLSSALRMPQVASPGYYPEQLACIDKALEGKPLRKGIAQYWDAKHFQMFSHQPIRLAQYVSDLTPHRWITSDRFYSDAYDFAIIAEDGDAQYKLPADMLAALSGAPAEKIACGSRTVLIYGPDKLTVKKINRAGSTFTWKGCELSMVLGKSTPACDAEKSDPQQEGFVTAGPYEALPVGEYAVEITYSSSMRAGEAAGEWEVALALPTEAKRILAGWFDGTSGQPQQVTGKFSIEKKFDMTKIDIRTLSRKGGTLKLTSLRLTRLK